MVTVETAVLPKASAEVFPNSGMSLKRLRCRVVSCTWEKTGREGLLLLRMPALYRTVPTAIELNELNEWGE
jgi:hypothetical protein